MNLKPGENATCTTEDIMKAMASVDQEHITIHGRILSSKTGSKMPIVWDDLEEAVSDPERYGNIKIDIDYPDKDYMDTFVYDPVIQ